MPILRKRSIKGAVDAHSTVLCARIVAFGQHTGHGRLASAATPA
jgi:hypothetical protein